MDLLVFFIDKKDLEGPFKEEVEGGVYENYSPKKDCMIIIYKYMQNGWVKIDSQKNVEGKIPRLFGESYIEKIAIKRIYDYLNRK